MLTTGACLCRRGTTLEAWTFSGTAGSCSADVDTVLTLWPSPLSGHPSVGGCSLQTGALACNDEGALTAPCSHLSYTVPPGQGGEHVLSVHAFGSAAAISDYGLLVLVR